MYFITVCVSGRQKLLATAEAHEILRSEWNEMQERHGWSVGRYVIMPDHVHFLAAPRMDSGNSLSAAIGKWKERTAKRITRTTRALPPVWQPEFFDHLLRSRESRSEKWSYVRENPVRAGLAVRAEDWPFAGTIHFE